MNRDGRLSRFFLAPNSSYTVGDRSATPVGPCRIGRQLAGTAKTSSEYC